MGRYFLPGRVGSPHASYRYRKTGGPNRSDRPSPVSLMNGTYRHRPKRTRRSLRKYDRYHGGLSGGNSSHWWYHWNHLPRRRTALSSMYGYSDPCLSLGVRTCYARGQSTRHRTMTS